MRARGSCFTIWRNLYWPHSLLSSVLLLVPVRCIWDALTMLAILLVYMLSLQVPLKFSRSEKPIALTKPLEFRHFFLNWKRINVNKYPFIHHQNGITVHILPYFLQTCLKAKEPTVKVEVSVISSLTAFPSFPELASRKNLMCI